MNKKILFVTGTRADFGKLYPLIEATDRNPNLSVSIFVTGMHLLKEYGHTYIEVLRKTNTDNYLFINQRFGDEMDTVFSKTVQGFSDYLGEHKPDLVVIHGDRVEAMAAAVVAMLNGIKIAHIEGGEISGTVDESMRHAITKISNLHFVANTEAVRRLIQLGEEVSTIFEIGSPEVDIMVSDRLPKIEEVKSRYDFDFESYGICIFHPVTTEREGIVHQVETLVEVIKKSLRNFIVILPNSDTGSLEILRKYKEIENSKTVRILPSMRFEHYLVALKNSDFIIGNSSSGVREAPFFGVPTLNLGSRQNGRSNAPTIHNLDFDTQQIMGCINSIESFERTKSSTFGKGGSGDRFAQILSDEDVWLKPIQKQFVDAQTEKIT